MLKSSHKIEGDIYRLHRTNNLSYDFYYLFKEIFRINKNIELLSQHYDFYNENHFIFLNDYKVFLLTYKMNY